MMPPERRYVNTKCRMLHKYNHRQFSLLFNVCVVIRQRAMKIDDAVNFFGSKAEIARVLGLQPNAVYHWRKIPLAAQYQLTIASDNVLIPDLPADRRTDELAAAIK